MAKGKYIALLLMTLTMQSTWAQQYSKMSRYVRQLVMEHNITSAAEAKGSYPTPLQQQDATLVFVKTLDDDAVKDYSVAHQGNVHICHVPVSELG